MNESKWLLCVLGAVLCWGSYGPAIHGGQVSLASTWRAFIFVGLAYFLMAIIVPGTVLQLVGDAGNWNSKGMLIATCAGFLGAGGALCIMFAFKNGGKPLYVMPLVFSGAPLINVIVTTIMHPPQKTINPLLYVGFVMAAIGAYLVLQYKPE